ncbi:MAG TPA: ABC transporter permease subunit [Planctomycetaceae bacterium]|jgi:ABC-type transport system involved in multi-copper enzyme maturation permease subunit|nr:ABC transporter permease subunit [Planctomycetaceae bacterium]
MSVLRRLPLASLRLPVLVKDLTELAAQRRTYLIRFVYGLVLFTSSGILFYANLGIGASARQTLGRGATYFAILLTLQILAMYLVIPLMTAGAIAAERQRETLVLLLLSPLTPWQIILQKYLSRMTPVLTFVFLSFPLLAITYTFGGVTVAELILGIVVLIFVCLELGAFGIMCSAWCATTAQALGATYVGALLFPWFCSGVCCTLPAAGLWGSAHVSHVAAVVAAGFSVFSTAACLTIAETVLAGRAFVTANRSVPPLFRWIDRLFEALNAVAGGIVLWRDRPSLPTREPIRWRETRKRSFGTPRYLARVLLAIELPVIILASAIRLYGAPVEQEGGLLIILGLTWMSAILLVGVFAASVVSQERSRQTLIVLLTSPLTGRQILEQKLAGVDRLMLVVSLPLVSLILFEFWWRSPTSGTYLLLSALTLVVYLPCVKWLATGLGLRMRTQLIAVVMTVLVLGIWTVATAAAIPILSRFHFDNPALRELRFVLSPIDAIRSIQRTASGSSAYVPASLARYRPFILHFALYAGLWTLLRLRCLQKIDRRLGRLPQPI